MAATTPTPDTLVPERLPLEAESVEPRGFESESLYRTIWRWHFYTGMLVAPILLVVAITGAIYVFETELSQWLYAGLYYVEPQGTRLNYDEQVQIAQQTLGDQEFEGFLLSTDPRRTTQVVAHIHPGGDENAQQQHRVLFVDPYRGKVIGEQILEQNFFSIALDIHRTLFVGSTGRIITELATSWGIVMLLTGTYLWWPRKQSNRGVWLPRITGKLYAVIRDWHAVSGIYVMAVAFLIMFTGLFFTLVWGTGYLMAAQATGQVPQQVFGDVTSKPHEAGAQPISLDQAVKTVLAKATLGDMVLLQIAHEPESAHRAFIFYDKDWAQGRVHVVDQYTGETLSYDHASELSPMFYARALAISIHMGKIFGLPTKLLALAASLILCGMIVTGVWMWWQRRPRGTWGLPRRPDAVRLGYALWSLIIGIGIILPTMGISLAIILLGDWLMTRVIRWR